MQPGDHDSDGEQPTRSWSQESDDPVRPDSTQVLPTVPAVESEPADPPASFTERSDAETQYLPPPPPVAEQYSPPTFGQSAYPPPPAYGQPSYGPPSYSPPSYGQPAAPYGQPEYNQPAPAYGQPPYQQPAYQQPAYQQPAYQQPAYQQPTYQQPTYQQAPYGPAEAYAQPGAEGAGRKKSRAGLWILLVVVVVIAAVVGALFAAKPSPLFKKVLDHTAVEQTIQTQSANGQGNYTRVSCPSNEKVTTGNTFECTAAGNKRISIKITNSKGDYVWSPAN
jgi:hypothetical protein